MASRLLGLPIPTAGGTDQVPADMLSLAQALEVDLVQIYASSAARTSAYTAAGISPAQGYLSYLISPGRFEVYNGSAWVVDKNLSKVGGQGGMVGTYAGQPLIVDTGTAVITVGASGTFSFNFAAAFPTGLLSCMVVGGNDSAVSFPADFGVSTLSTFHGLAFGPIVSGSLQKLTNGTTVNIIYTAYGW